jgi:type IV secretory pathway VirB9-like protein
MVNVVNNVTLKEINNDVIATTPDVNLNNLNFDYCVACNGIFSHCPSWRPTRIFDDGVHTYIQFPASMANRDMPALFVLEGSQNQLVNYRSKPPYFVVDKIFREAVLIIGVGNHQTKVRIVNRHY